MKLEATSLPADIAVVHAFLNTLDLRSFRWHGNQHSGGDSIATPAGLAAWLSAHDLLRVEAGAITVGEPAVRAAHDLRARLRAAVAGQTDPAPPGRIDLRLSLAPGLPPTLVPAGSGVDAGLARITLAAVRAGASGTWPRLKMCIAPDCRWVFYDQSRPGRGRWCAPDLCGNRMKTRDYRQRQHQGLLSHPREVS